MNFAGKISVPYNAVKLLIESTPGSSGSRLGLVSKSEPALACFISIAFREKLFLCFDANLCYSSTAAAFEINFSLKAVSHDCKRSCFGAFLAREVIVMLVKYGKNV